MPLTPELTTPPEPPSTASRSSKSQRVLACVLCQQRKVKCDRKFPCANCLKLKAECVPSALHPRRRKRRFPERELLDRVRKYERLLRQNKIDFDPLQKDNTVDLEPSHAADDHISPDEQAETLKGHPSSQSAPTKPRGPHHTKNLWRAMNQQDLREPGYESESSAEEISQGVKKAWDQLFKDNEDILPFGARRTGVELSTLHPDPIQIFKLWQIYLDNVDPLLKVTHTPSLQARIIEAASNLTNINPTLQALMFSIYSMSLMSLTADECQTAFGSSKEDLMAKYQFACQQALLACGYLRTGDRECLSAFYLFLVSIGPKTDPRSLSSMLGVGMRIAHRIGIHSESAGAKCTPFESELRRRLWWSYKLFDTRIGELADYKNVALASTWDCKIPLNVNDSELRPEMKQQPSAQITLTEAVFVVVCSELREYVRHTKFHSDFHTPALDTAPKQSRQRLASKGDELDALEKMIQDKYLKLCNPENPLHFMTIWMTRAYLAKCRLVEHYSMHGDNSKGQSTEQRDVAVRHALGMLQADSQIMNSPLTKGYRWLLKFYFPLPAYIHVLQDLKKRPTSAQYVEAWEAVSDNFEARIDLSQPIKAPLFNIFAKLVHSAWEAHLANVAKFGGRILYPKIVKIVKDNVLQRLQSSQDADAEEPRPPHETESQDEDLPMEAASDFRSQSVQDGSIPDYYAGMDEFLGQDLPTFDLDQMDLALMNWDPRAFFA